MPLIRIETNVGLEEQRKTEIMNMLSRSLAEDLGKEEKWVMVSMAESAILMGGEPGPAAYVDVRSIGGLNNETNNTIAQHVSKVLHEEMGVAPERLYVNLDSVSAGNWCWNAKTFG